jgi:hypothetical protein
MQLVIRQGDETVFASYADEIADVAAKHAGLGPCEVVTVPDATSFLVDESGARLDPRKHPAPAPPAATPLTPLISP